MEQPKTGQNSSTAGLIGGAFGLAKNLLGLVISRLELAALEFSEIGGNLLKIAVLFALALTAGWFAVAYWSVLIVLLAWDSWGWKILLLMALVFTVLTIALALYVRAFLRQGKIALPDTMAELRKDRDALL
jgi:uncharacterized membrane protein YqjE